MSNKVKINAFVYEVNFGYSEKPAYRILGSDNMADDWYTLIGPAEFEYEIPASFNPTQAKLAALEKAKSEVRAAYLAKVREIEERISKLQAIEYEVPA